MASSLSFCWGEACSHWDPLQQRRYYQDFNLQGTAYRVGDPVLLLSEDEGRRNFTSLARIISAFADTRASAGEAYSIEVRWLEPLGSGSGRQGGAIREVVELDEPEVNPIGCLTGKASVLDAPGPEEAERMAMAQGLTGEVFFCRGIFNQSRNEFVPYDHTLTPSRVPDAPRKAAPAQQKRSRTSSDDDDDEARQPAKAAARAAKRVPKARRQPPSDSCSLDASALLGCASSSLASGQQRRGKSVGQQCVECGATQTPQWREGPAGPKTLCNACGVRYNRMRSSRKAGGGSGMRQAMRAKASKAGAAQKVAGESAAASLLPDPQQHAAFPDMLQQRPRQQGKQAPGAGAGEQRPVRRAALVSAHRNAAFARMGMFSEEAQEYMDATEEEEAGQEEEEEEEEHEEMRGDGKCVELRAGADAETAAVSSRSHDGGQPAEECSLTSSQSSEGRLQELRTQLWQQQQQQQQRSAALLSAGSSLDLTLHQEEPLCSSVHAMGFDPSMAWRSYCSDLGAEGTPEALTSPPAALGSRTPAQGSWAEEAAAGQDTAAASGAVRGAALRALGFCADAAEFAEVFARFEAVQAALPAEAVRSLLGATQLVEAATSEAASAEAALQAVAKVLAARQKAADASREQAAGAVEKLKLGMTELLHKHGLSGSCCSSDDGGDGPEAVPSSQDLAQAMLGLDAHKLDMGWGHHQLDQEHSLSLLDSNPLVVLGAADNGASLLSMDSGFAALIKA